MIGQMIILEVIMKLLHNIQRFYFCKKINNSFNIMKFFKEMGN